MKRIARKAVLGLANNGKLLTFIIFADWLICSAAYDIIEGRDIINSLLWGIVTASTTGYGDQYPVSTAGRGVAAFFMVSMMILWLLAGANITAKLIVDNDVFSHREQESIKTMLLALSITQGLVPKNTRTLEDAANVVRINFGLPEFGDKPDQEIA